MTKFYVVPSGGIDRWWNEIKRFPSWREAEKFARKQMDNEYRKILEGKTLSGFSEKEKLEWASEKHFANGETTDWDVLTPAEFFERMKDARKDDLFRGDFERESFIETYLDELQAHVDAKSAAAIGRRGGKKATKAKSTAARENGKKGGRPLKG